MKKLNILLSLFLFVAASLQAQEAKTCFINMPDSLNPLLTPVNRADFIDFLESKMKAEVTNSFGGKSEMTELSPDYISVVMTPQSTWQMKLLAVNDSTKVICTVSTVCAPACDSHLNFYTTDWKELSLIDFLSSLPTLSDFIAEASDTADIYTYQDASRQADILLMKADLSAQASTLTFTFTTPDYMDKEVVDKLKPFLLRPKVYVWKDSKFVVE